MEGKAHSEDEGRRLASVRRPGSWRELIMFGLGLALVSGCGSLGYYAQAGWGAVRLMGKARPIEALLRSQRLSPDLRRQLETAIEAREFAITELSLPDNGSYRQYADLGRPYAVWNVVAAPEFSLDPLIWCFPVAGCVTYRGYFSEARAQRYAVRLRRRDFDVSVKGVRAYSTLGHLRDPILNTFVDKPRPELAQMIFHELAHQVAYVKDDTSFNESLASFVAREGVRRYLAHSDTGGLESFGEEVRREEETVSLLLSYRNRLALLFEEELSQTEMRRRKGLLFQELEERLAKLTGRPGVVGLNNADLASVEAYYDHIPAFAVMLEEVEGDLPRFYDRVRDLAALDRDERTRRLRCMPPLP